MFHHINGVLTEKAHGYAVVEASGVGYLLKCSVRTLSDLPSAGQQVCVLVHAAYRETEAELYGFATREERALFQNLIKVSGVGPSLSLGMLGQQDYERLVQAIATSDTLSLSKLKGIGKKTAERIVLELRDRLKAPEGVPQGVKLKIGQYPKDAYLALMALGLDANEASRRLERVAEANPNAEDTELWIKQALANG